MLNASMQMRAHLMASSLNDPLLSVSKQTRLTDDSSDESSIDTNFSVLTDEPNQITKKEAIVATVTAVLLFGGLAASAAAMVAAQTIFVFVMGGVCIANTPVVAQRQYHITKSKGVRASINMLIEEINLLKSEVDFLTQSVDDLQAEADDLKLVEDNLNEIALAQGQNVTELVNLVQENEGILKQMKINLRQSFVSELAKIVMRSDTDGDMKIDPKEAPLLALRLKIQLTPFGVELDTNRFEAMIKEDNDIGNVMKFCGEVLFAMTMNDDEEEDDDYDDGVDSELTFEDLCKQIAEEEDAGFHEMTTEDKMSMISVQDKFSKGSVEVARGKRMTLMPTKDKGESRRKTIVKEAHRRATKMAVRRATLNLNQPKVSFGHRQPQEQTLLIIQEGDDEEYDSDDSLGGASF
eukprot:g4167.t1 g4167   contig15:479678-481380(+)